MAIHEACQLFIEQQIREGLDSGKAPYSIGKEIAGWVAKLFETTISAKTIAKKAERASKNLATFVAKDTSTGKQKEKQTIQDFKWGGSREGAGRKPLPQPENKKQELIRKIEAANLQKINSKCGFNKKMYFAQKENKEHLAFTTVDGCLDMILKAMQGLDGTEGFAVLASRSLFCQKWESVFEILDPIACDVSRKINKIKEAAK